MKKKSTKTFAQETVWKFFQNQFKHLVAIQVSDRVKYSGLLTGHSWLSSVPTGSTCSPCGERRGKRSHKARCSPGAVAPPPPRAGAAPVRRVQTGAVQGAVSSLREGAPSTHRQVTLLDQVARSIESPLGGGPIHIFWVFFLNLP